MNTKKMIEWLFNLAFPKSDSFEGWVTTDQDEGHWECRFCNAQKENGWKHEDDCKYAEIKKYLLGDLTI